MHDVDTISSRGGGGAENIEDRSVMATIWKL